MNIKITYYLDLTSSWCYWAEPAWAKLKQRYANSPVEFDWQIALLDASGMSKSREQAEWYYRRSGTIVQSPFMLNSGWLDPVQPEFLAINCVAEAAKDFGVSRADGSRHAPRLKDRGLERVRPGGGKGDHAGRRNVVGQGAVF